MQKIKQSFEVKNQKKKKAIHFMLTEKTITIRLIDGWTKKMSLRKTNYHSALDSHRSNKIKLELYLSYYKTKSDVKKQQFFHTSGFIKRLI